MNKIVFVSLPIFGLLIYSAQLAHAQAQPSNETDNRLQNEAEQSAACITQLKNNSNFRLLYVKLPFDEFSKSQPLEVLANTTKPTLKEKSTLSAYSSERERCLDLALDWQKKTFPPELNSLVTTHRTESLAVLADLYAGKLTFGDAAKLRLKLASTYYQNFDTLRLNYESNARAQKDAADQQQAQNRAREREIENQRLVQMQAQQRANEQAKRERDQQQFMNGMLLLQAGGPKFGPPVPDPFPSIRCTSRGVGNTVQTNCF